MDIEQEVKAMTGKIEDFIGAQSKISADLKELNTKSGDVSASALKAVEAQAEKIEGLANDMLEIKQSATESVLAGKMPVQTLGQMVIASDEYAAFAKNGRMTFQANTITGQEGDPATNSDTIVAPQRLNGIIGGASRLLRVSDVLMQGVTTSNAVTFTQESLFTNNADGVVEGATKPESVLEFALKSADVATIAHTILVSKQVLDDAPMLQSYIDTRMRYGVDNEIDKQLIVGDGLTGNISGMLKSGNYTAFTPEAGENALDSINRAIYDVYAQDYAPTAIIMNPADWGAIERIKRGSGDASYVFGDPGGVTGPMLWGLPVVVTNAMTAGSFIVAAFDIAYQLWNREGTVVEMFPQDGDNVKKNLLTIRAEARKALATYRPASVQSGLLVAA